MSYNSRDFITPARLSGIQASLFAGASAAYYGMRRGSNRGDATCEC